MSNPFEEINSRLERIEFILLDRKLETTTDNLSTADDFLTVNEAADLLHLKKPTVYSKVSRGELPVMKRGKRLYFSKQELLEYVQAGRKDASSVANPPSLLSPKEGRRVS